MSTDDQLDDFRAWVFETRLAVAFGVACFGAWASGFGGNRRQLFAKCDLTVLIRRYL